MADQFDDIVIGAGSAGCVLANRLSADPGRRVLVLEAGGKDDWIWFHIPVGYLFAIGNPRSDWMFQTDAIPGLGGRSLAYPRGKVIGGCSAINAMIYMRGQAADYDGWRQMGLAGWGWDDVLPLFLAQEDHIAPQGPLHRAGGEWRVEHPRMRWAVLDAFAQAAEMAGIPQVADFNSGDNFGAGYFQVNQKAGRRWSAAAGFLKPILKRPNLKLETHAHVTRILIENGRAVGVAWLVAALIANDYVTGEVVLAAGAVATPKLLELSGIGDGERLRGLGVETLAHRPGVGGNLQDHLDICTLQRCTQPITYDKTNDVAIALEFLLRRQGIGTSNVAEVGGFVRTRHAEDGRCDMQFHFVPAQLDDHGRQRLPGFGYTLHACALRPKSRGHIALRSADPGEKPAIHANYLSDAEGYDLKMLIEGVRLSRGIFAQDAFGPYRGEEILPGVGVREDRDIEAFVRRKAETIYHPVGTCRMGSDAGAVVDAELRERIFSRIEAEWTLTRNHLLAILEQDDFLADNLMLKQSLRLRAPYMDPLNHLQVELLKRHRAGDTDERIARGIHLTINGIASGLRNSG